MIVGQFEIKQNRFAFIFDLIIFRHNRMSKTVANFLLSAILLLGLAVCIYPQAAWMSDNAAILSKKQLNQIALPGAHDAGTFAIAANAGSAIGSGDGLSSPDNKKVKRILSLGPVFGNWAKTQERTTTEMLNDGIRYFDLHSIFTAD